MEYLQGVFNIDVEHLRQTAQSGTAKKIKRRWIKRGYDKQLSLYGIITNTAIGESNYERIEVLSNTPYTERIVALIYDFFKGLKPPTSYSIWIYDSKRDAVRQVAKYGAR